MRPSPKKIDEARHCRHSRADKSCAKEPQRSRREGIAARLPENDVKQECRDEKANRQRDEDRMKRMTGDIRRAHRIACAVWHLCLQVDTLEWYSRRFVL